ncbi:hypothetical protein TWF694_002481 [Orbilia ellipsospora]|uniref:Uncharacterized protein n=1 Tax=Orbilia ellipsospora TaxID=2528407 RepID=A0AAV9X235_9PEZI
MLEAGSYSIKSSSLDAFIGLDPDSNDSFAALPLGAPPAKWQISPMGDNKFRIESNGFLAAEKSNELKAVSDGEPAWIIDAISHHGPNLYIILSAEDGGRGWCAGYEPGESIKARPLLIGPSLPPFYPPNERFEIVPVGP